MNSELNKVYKFSEEHRKKLSDSNKGRIVSELTRKKMSESRIGKRWSKGRLINSKIEDIPEFNMKELEELLKRYSIDKELLIINNKSIENSSELRKWVLNQNIVKK